MTRAEFERMLSSTGSRIAIRPPYEVVKCSCRDVNCHGWRLVPQRAPKTRLAAVAGWAPR